METNSTTTSLRANLMVSFFVQDNFKPIFDVLMVLNKINDCIGKKPPEFVLNQK
jgi:hypothetical protein